jgi:adenosylcobyric acid synthase
MLGQRIADPDGIESSELEVPGLGLLPIETVFEGEKLLSRPEGRAAMFEDQPVVSGYEIRHGRVYRHWGAPLFITHDGEQEGCRVGAIIGTSWHGVLESDGFRRELVRWAAEERGLDWVPGNESFAAAREAQMESLGDLVAENVDREALLRVISDGAPDGLPILRHQVSGFGHQESKGEPDDRRTIPGSNGEASVPGHARHAAPASSANGFENLKAET